MFLKSISTYSRRRKSINFASISDIPFSIFLSICGIIAIGSLSLYSAASGSFYPWLQKQIFFYITGFFLFFFIISLNVRIIRGISYLSMIGTIALLAIVYIVGKHSMGATRWLDLKIFTIQPSELAKISIILVLARYFDSIKRDELNRIKHSIIPIIIIAPMFLLILLQPDFTTAMILIGIIGIIFFISGKPMWQFYSVGICTISAIPFIWMKMKKYQKLRIINFFNPENDPLGSGYNAIQSKIAIGSGGIFGKGLLNGTQGQLKFLPEHHTDFIFSIIGEEWGFLGSIIVLFLYGYIIYYGFMVSIRVKSQFCRIIAIGCSSIFFLHLFINVGMAIALLPVAGIPLPLISYGGTITIISLICLALIINADINKDYDGISKY